MKSHILLPTKNISSRCSHDELQIKVHYTPVSLNKLANLLKLDRSLPISRLMSFVRTRVVTIQWDFFLESFVGTLPTVVLSAGRTRSSVLVLESGTADLAARLLPEVLTVFQLLPQ